MDRMEFKARAHPSGRPIDRRVAKERPIWRIPDTEPNVPRLRVRDGVPAIGFTHKFVTVDGEEF